MNQLHAGIARRIITPPPGTRLFGYPSVRLGQQVADDLAATALALRRHETTVLLVSLDWCVIDEEETRKVRAAIAAQTGIDGRHITLSATHTHSGPQTAQCWGWGDPNSAYLEATRPSIVEAAVEALGRLEPVRAGIGVTSTDTGINRREIHIDGNVGANTNPWGPRDSDLTVLRLQGNDGPVAALVHLCAHPTARGQEPSVSRDWPGVMIDRMETVTGAPVLFINGTFGDIGPRNATGQTAGDGAIAALEAGLTAAGDAVRAWRGIKEFRDLELETLCAQFEMPWAPLPLIEEAQRQVEERASAKDIALGVEACEWKYWNAVLQAHKEPAQSGRPFDQTLTRLGPLVIVPFPGEVFSEIGLRLKRASPFAHTVCAGTTNGSNGYFVTREARARGGYEPWVAKAFGAHLLADNIDDVLVRENLELLKRLSVQPNTQSMF